MDLNDQKKRLLALQQSSPPLRIAPTVNYNLKVDSTVPKVQPPVDTRSTASRIFDQVNQYDNGRTFKQATPTTTDSGLTQFGKLGSGNIGTVRSLIGGVQGISGLVDLLSPGKGTSRVTQTANKLAEGTDNIVKKYSLSPGAYKVGQGATDVAQFLVPGIVAGKIASKVPQLVELGSKAPLLARVVSKLPQFAKDGSMLEKFPLISKILAKIAPEAANVAVDTLSSAGQRTARGQDVSLGNITTDAAISAGTQGLLSGFGYVGGKIVDKVQARGLAEFLSKENDPGVIKEILGVDEKIAQDLAKSTDPERIMTDLEKLQFSEVHQNAPKALSEPSTASAVQTGFQNSTGKDPLDIAINTLAGTTKKSEVRTLIDNLMPSIDGTAKNKLIRDLTKETDPNKIAQILADNIDNLRLGSIDATASMSDLSQRPRTPSDVPGGLTPTDIGNGVDGTPPISPVLNTGAPGSVTEAAQAVSKADGSVTPAMTPETPGATSTAGVNATLGDTVNANADSAINLNNTVSTVTNSNLPESVQSAADSIINGSKDMKSAADRSKVLIRKQKGQRIAAGSDAFDAAGGGEAGVRALKSRMAGTYNKGAYNTIDITDTQFADLINHVHTTAKSEFDTLNFANAIGKATGREAGIPTSGDIAIIKKYLGKDVSNAVVEQFSGLHKFLAHVADISGIPKALMASGDLSFGGRQGAVLGSLHPKQWAKANLESVKYAASPEYFNKSMQGIRNLEDANGEKAFDFMTSRMGVQLEAATGGTEEAFSGFDSVWSKIKDKYAGDEGVSKALDIAGKYNFVSGSDRAFSGAASQLRSSVAMDIINKYGGVKAMEDWSPKATSDLGRVINTATGRGDLGAFEKYGPALSKTLFSPRLWKAKLDTLNPVYYARLSTEARKEALKSSAAFAGVISTTLAAAAAAGANIEIDPRSSDFMKVKVGNTRYDIMGGLQQNIVLAAREITGQKKNSETGDIVHLSGDLHKFGQADRGSIITDFLQNKSNPLLNTAATIIKGEDKGGNAINPWQSIAKLFIPLNAQSTYETANDYGNVNPLNGEKIDVGAIAKGAALNVPGIFGVGVQTYGSTASKNIGTPSADNNPTWKGKIDENMVTDKSGNVVLDSKGKPVKVKFDTGASSIEKTALKDKALEAAQSDKYRRNLSTEDQALLKLSSEQRQKYLDSGAITQVKSDQLDQYSQDIKNLNGVGIPKELKSTAAKDFYKEYNSKTSANQDKFLTDTPSEPAKKISEAVNKDLPAGIDKLNPSNRLAKAYSDYEIDLAKHSEYTDIDKRNKLRTFLTSSVKGNQSQQVQDIFSEGGSRDTGFFMANGLISKEDLNSAINLDNQLYNSGLTGSLKFTKKFRTANGYDTPAGRDGGGGGSGGGDSTVRAGITGLLPSMSKTPSFSQKSTTPRSLKFKSTVKKPVPSSKRVTIKL